MPNRTFWTAKLQKCGVWDMQGFFLLNPGRGCLVSGSENPHRAPGAGGFSLIRIVMGESSFDFNGIYIG